jgi:hypothetical protein
MNLILQMAETESKQVAMTGAAIEANEFEISESLQNTQNHS